MPEPTVHTHPNINNMSITALHHMIEQKRGKRLLLAIDTHKKRQAKLDKLTTKAQEQYTKLGDRIVTRLAKIEAQLDLCELDLRKMQAHNNDLDLFSNSPTADEETGFSDDE